MLLPKTRAVPLSKEKPKRNPDKPYFTPTCYSPKKKSEEDISISYKKEDAI